MKSTIKILGKEYILILNEVEANWLHAALTDSLDFEDDEKDEFIRNCFLDALNEDK